MGQAQPPLPGGWKEGDVVFYTAAGQCLASGDALVYAARGQIAGPSLVKDGSDDKRVAVQFPGNAGPVACRTEALSLEPPPECLANGWRVGDTAIYVGGCKTLPDGDRLLSGSRCEVVGPAPDEDPSAVAVLFPGHKAPVITGSLAREDASALSGPLDSCLSICLVKPERLDTGRSPSKISTN